MNIPSLRWEGIKGRVMRPTFLRFTLTLDSVIRGRALTSPIKGEEPIR